LDRDSARGKDFDSDKAYVADVRAGVAKAMATLKNDYKAKTIYIALPPLIYHDPTAENLEAESLTKAAWSNVSLEKILPAIREAAKENGIKVIDVNAEFKGKEKAFGKGVHYNESGKKKVAEMYADALGGTLIRSPSTRSTANERSRSR
jgi:lysophospholipase L1-like esterase